MTVTSERWKRLLWKWQRCYGRVPGEIPGFEPFLYYHTFDNSSINFTVRLPIKEFSDQYMIKHVFIKRLHKRYNKEGIDIPFPIRTVFMNQ